jgi:PAS domain-containing protein
VPHAETIGQDFSSRDFFREAMQTRQPYLSGVYVSKAAQRPVVATAVPVLRADGRVAGVLVGALSLQTMSRLVSVAAHDDGRAIFLVDSRGQLIADFRAAVESLRDERAEPAVQAVLSGRAGTMAFRGPGRGADQAVRLGGRGHQSNRRGPGPRGTPRCRTDLDCRRVHRRRHRSRRGVRQPSHAPHSRVGGGEQEDRGRRAGEPGRKGLDDYVLEDPQRSLRLPAAARSAVEHARQRVAAQAAEVRYQALIEGAPVGLVQSRPDGRMLAANPAAARIWGLSRRGVVPPGQRARAVHKPGRSGSIDGDPRERGYRPQSDGRRGSARSRGRPSRRRRPETAGVDRERARLPTSGSRRRTKQHAFVQARGISSGLFFGPSTERHSRLVKPRSAQPGRGMIRLGGLCAAHGVSTISG